MFAFRSARLLALERQILKDLGFCVYGLLDHPHHFLDAFCAALALPDTVLERAWAYANDAGLTDLGARVRPEVLACASLLLASRALGWALPPLDGRAWTEVLAGAPLREVEAVACGILSVPPAGPTPVWLVSLEDDDAHEVEERGLELAEQRDAALDSAAEEGVEGGVPSARAASAEDGEKRVDAPAVAAHAAVEAGTRKRRWG